MALCVKAQLANFFTSSVNGSVYQRQAKHVINGGALLHRVKWAKKTTYHSIAMQYVSYVHSKYGGRCCICFDGYEQGPSIKDHEHQRRAKKTCADIKLSENMEAYYTNQEIFLANERNKRQFILSG